MQKICLVVKNAIYDSSSPGVDKSGLVQSSTVRVELD